MKRKLLAAILALTVLLTGAAIVETTARMRSAATMAADRKSVV